MKNISIFAFLGFLLAAVPMQLYAASSNTLGSNLQAIIVFFDSYVVPLIFAIAFIMFLWGVFQYFIWGAANDDSREKGRNFILYAIIGFVLMFCIWGIVTLLKNSLGFESNTRPSYPTFNNGTTNTNTTNSTSNSSSNSGTTNNNNGTTNSSGNNPYGITSI